VKKRSWVTVIILLAVSYYVIHSWFIGGVIQVPKTDLFLVQYNDLDKVKTWDQLKSEHPSVDPAKAGLGSTTIATGVSLTVRPWSAWDELLYPKSVVPISVTVSVESATQYLQSPTLLVLLLDENDKIRGKLFTAALMPEPMDGPISAEVRFWFRVPADMIERRYAIVAELFGLMQYKPNLSLPSGPGMTLLGYQYQQIDNIYGLLPAWPEHPTLRAYARSESRLAPSTSISFSSMLSDISLISVVLPALTGILVAFRRRGANFVRRNPELSAVLNYVSVSVVFFLLLVLALVLLK